MRSDPIISGLPTMTSERKVLRHGDRGVAAPSDDLASEILEAAPDGVLLVDPAGTIRYANPALEEMLGHRQGELEGRPIEDLVPERQRAVHRSHRHDYGRDPRPRPMGVGRELTARARDGSEVPVEISLSPLAGSGGPAVLAIVRDLREHREAEATMRRLHRLLDATDDGVIVFDVPSLRLTYANQGAAAQTGLRRDDLVGRTVPELPLGFTAPDLHDLLEPLVTGELLARSVPATVRRPDDATLPVEIVVQAPPDEEGGHRAAIAIVRDVSERARAQEELQQAHDALLMTEERERIARDLHDTVIQRLFATGLLLQATLASASANEAERIEQAVEELDETIKDIRTAIFALHTPEVGATSVRREVLETAADATRGLGFEPRVRFEGPVDTRVGLEIRRQLVPTLRESLTNVARHAHATSTTVVLEALGDEVRLVVDDDGEGLGARVEHGHGLENIADRARVLGGRCTVESSPAGGTRVDWRVPRT